MHYQLLGNSGLKVSEICLGTMTFGEDWGFGADKEVSRQQLETFVEAGGNFVDTANLYTNGTSEAYLGDFIASERDYYVLATKYTLHEPSRSPNDGGNSRKNLMQSLEASLKRLKTDYIDLYWVHAWDEMTPTEELMRALDDAVRAGKVRYVGVSDFPAWKVAQANTLAHFRGWSPFVALQIEYSLIERTVEAELIPMAQELNLTVTPWSPLAGGILTGKYLKGAKEGRMKDGDVFERMDDRADRIAQTVLDIAEEVGHSPAQVALNWLRAVGPHIPIIGARTLVQLKDNLACLKWSLTPEQVERLNAVSTPPPIFPSRFLANARPREVIHAGLYDSVKR